MYGAFSLPSLLNLLLLYMPPCLYVFVGSNYR